MSDKCSNKRHIIVPLQGIPGPQGPPGPPGPPGESVQLPIPADQVSVTNPGFNNVQEVLDYLLYNPIVINSFQATVDTYEIGSIVNSLTFNWTLNQDPVSQTLTGPLITPPSLIPSQRAVTLAVSSLQGSIPGDSFSYLLTVLDSLSGQDTATESIRFYNGVYYGDADIPGVIDSNFILGFTKRLQAGKARTFTSNATGTQHAWYCWRKALGLATFTVGQFQGGFEAPVTVSFTNQKGYTEDYYIARSTNPDIGPVTISVS